jgi:hypothetical protein
MLKNIVVVFQLTAAIAAIAFYAQQQLGLSFSIVTVLVIVITWVGIRKNPNAKALFEVAVPLIGAYVMVQIEFLGIPAAVVEIVLLFLSILL